VARELAAGSSSTRGRTPALAATAVVAVVVALVVIFRFTPDEAVMGPVVRILYVHVGAAWTAYLAYGVTALGALIYLRTGRLNWDRLAVASAEWGVVLTTLTLLSGSLWARATQGWWWRWDDARLTLTLMLWFLYVAYLILRQYTAGERRATLSAVIALAGVPAMVLDHFATVLFPAFHPPPVAARSGGPALDVPFQIGLAAAVVAFTLVYAAVLQQRLRLEGELAQLEGARARHSRDGD
jgi:heme exporter protein C